MPPFSQTQFIQKRAITLAPETSVEFAVQMMSQESTSYVLVVEQHQILGIFSTQELVKAIASGLNLTITTLADVMTGDVMTVKESELGNIYSVISLLQEQQISHLPVLDAQGQLLGVITHQSIQQALPQKIARYEQLVEIQHQQQAQTAAALRESEERLQLALAASGDGLWDWNLLTGEVYLSDRWCEMLGYSADELYHNLSTWEQLIHPDDRSWVMNVLQSHLQDSSIPYSFEYQMQTKSGEWKWIANHGKVVMWDNCGQPLRMIGIHRDISDRKRAELALQEREAFLRGIGDRVPKGYIYQLVQELDGSNRFYYVSAGVEQTNGFKPEAILADSSLLFNIIVPEDLAYMLQKQQESAANMSVFDVQVREYSPEGDIRWVRVCSSPRRMDDGRICWDGIRFDITDLKNTEETLRKSKALLTEAQKVAKIGNWEFDLIRQKITWTEELFHIFERDPGLGEPNYEDLLELYHPESAARLSKAVEISITTGESYKLILRRNTATGKPPCYIEGTGQAEFNADGQVIRIYGTAQDITERFLAQKALQEQEKFLRSIYNGVEQCIFVVDILEDNDFRFAGLNPLAERLSGISSLEIQGKTPENIFPAEIALSIRQHYQACIAAGKTISYEECLPFQGEDTWWITSLTPLFNEQSRVYRIIGSSIEISDRKQAEEKLRQAELRYRNLLEQIPGVVYTAPITATAEFAYISPQIYQLLQIPAEEWVAGHLNTWSDYIYPDDGDRVKNSFEHTIKTGEPLLAEYRMLTRDGQIIWVRDQASLVIAPDGKTPILQGIAFNISDRKKLELALRASEIRLQSILTTANASIVSFRAFANYDWEYEYQSIGSESLFGYSPEEIISDKQLWMSQVFAEDRDTVLYPLFGDIFAERTTNVEFRFYHKDGSLRWISATYTSHRDEAADCWIVTGVSVDISDRKRLELALQTSEKRLNNILSTASASIFSFRMTSSQEWEYEYQSKASEIIFGYTPAELLTDKMLWLSRVFPEDREKVRYSRFLHSISEGACTIEYRFRHKDDSLRWISTTYSAYRQETGDGWVVIGVSIDISDRKRAEEAVRQNETLFRTLSDSAPIGIFRTDAQGKNIYTNPRFQAICGLSFAESLGDRWMQFIHPEDLAEFLPRLHALTTANQEFYTEIRYILRDATWRFCRITIVPLLADSNELMGYVGTIEDITESRAIETMKKEFISIVSHELRTPLASIRGALGLLSSGVLKTQPETAQQMLDIAYSDTERLVRLVNDILDLEHLESNKFNLVKQWCDTATILRQSVEAVKPLATENDVSLVMVPSSVQIWVDSDRIMQTLVNLIGNAIKFSPANSQVTVTVEELSDRVLFKVQDQGRGIPETMLESIFGRFQQVDASDSRQKGGTGLGLAICRGIVQQHGGKIWVESALGKGSTFYFTIPKFDER
ncbi:PAS domain-containing protein [Calothrix sp. FACHB-1219]|uniref:PAS domain-containing protein n=1 Tax=unclassified Calothrix TaxID=2619626 RepID=UPI001683574A|nr:MULTISPECIES: PAS domain-containing protein [unclassified Calothrix]MBD2207643.1 PAS domain-containing protein [Calothrix sp. FACHB-168]MBD2222284.1 PAS domain-containing protein [Calothrix sp. FACHB-1219]